MANNQPQPTAKPSPTPAGGNGTGKHGEDPDRTDVDLGDAKSVAERSKDLKARELLRIDGMRKLLDNAEGRLWLWDLLTFCGISRTSFDGTSKTYFNEGARNVGLRIQADLTRHFPARYVQMLNEYGGETK